VYDAFSAVTGAVNLAQSFLDGVQHGGWLDPLSIVRTMAGAIGVAGDIVGLGDDPLATVVQWAVTWLFEHAVPLRVALDGLAGNPDAIAGYAQTWTNIGNRLAQVGSDFAGSVQSGPGNWSGAAHDSFHTMAADTSASITAAAMIASGLSSLISGLGDVVTYVRGLIESLIAELVKTLVADAPEALAGDETQAAGGVIQDITNAVSKVAYLLTALLALAQTIHDVIPAAQAAFAEIAKAAQKWVHG
jgi:uncharacterized protein YukE